MAEVSITYKLYDFVTQSVTNIQKNIGALNSSLAKAAAYFDDLGKRAFIFNQLSQATQGFSQSISSITQPGMQFQQQLADLQAITGIAGKDLEKLGEAAKKVGADSGLGAAQAVEAFKLLASNIDVTTIGGVEGLKKLQQETIVLAKASGVDLPTAANTMAAAINQFGLSADEASRVINVLGAGAKFGAAEIPHLAESLKVAGVTAAQSGLSIESTVGAIEVLSQNALKGSEAGTALRNIMLKMQKELGVDFNTTSFAEALNALKPKLSDVSYLTNLFGLENVNAAQILIANAEAVGEMTEKVTGTSVAYEQAEIRSQTYAEQLQRIKASVDNLKIGLFEATGALLPYGEVLAGYLAGFSQLVPGLLIVKDAISWVTNIQNLHTTATKIATLITNGFTLAVNFLNTAFIASPIGWIVLAIGALIAAIVIAWNKFEGFRQVVMGVWEVIKQLGSAIWDFIKAFAYVMSGQFSKAKESLSEGWDKIKTLGEAYNRGVEKQKQKESQPQTDTAENHSYRAKTNTTKGIPYLESTETNSPTLAPGVSQVASSAPKVFNLNIQKLIEKFEISTTTINQSNQQIRDLVLKALMEAVNDSQMASL